MALPGVSIHATERKLLTFSGSGTAVVQGLQVSRVQSLRSRRTKDGLAWMPREHPALWSFIWLAKQCAGPRVEWEVCCEGRALDAYYCDTASSASCVIPYKCVYPGVVLDAVVSAVLEIYTSPDQLNNLN